MTLQMLVNAGERMASRFLVSAMILKWSRHTPLQLSMSQLWQASYLLLKLRASGTADANLPLSLSLLEFPQLCSSVHWLGIAKGVRLHCGCRPEERCSQTLA